MFIKNSSKIAINNREKFNLILLNKLSKGMSFKHKKIKKQLTRIDNIFLRIVT